MIRFKQKDRTDNKLSPEDLKEFESNQKNSWKDHKGLTKWENSVKLKVKQK